MASRRRRGGRSRKSSGTNWGSVVLWGLGISAGLFVLSAATGVAVLKSVADSPPQLPTMTPNAQQMLNQMTSPS